MKKLIAIFLLMGMMVSFAACGEQGTTQPETTAGETTTAETTVAETTETEIIEATTTEDTTSEITLEDVYNAGKNLPALLGARENVFVQVASNGIVIREEYLDKQYSYSYYSAEFMDIGFNYGSLSTDTTQYYCLDNVYALNVTLAPDGIVHMTDLLASAGPSSFISSDMLNDDAATIVDENGLIIVTCTADEDELAQMGEDIVSCVETYTLDATTREMISIKTVFTYEDGTIEEGVTTITRDVETPEGMTIFLAYARETEDLRTVTIVSNPGTEAEKTESIQVPKGLQVALAADFDSEETFTVYADAACTQTFEGEWSVDTDLTLYVKWDE